MNDLKERFLRDGVDGLSEVDVLELLLTYAMPSADARPTAHELLKEFGGLKQVLSASTVDLSDLVGIESNSAALISLVRELMTYLAAKRESAPELLTSPQDLQAYLLARLKDVNDAQVLVVFLDSDSRVLGEELVGAGTIDRVVVFPRQIMQGALRYRASELLLAHNHPHGPPIPSQADREAAERLRDILLPFDLLLRDSIVVGKERCFSVFRNCLLDDCR